MKVEIHLEKHIKFKKGFLMTYINNKVKYGIEKLMLNILFITLLC